ncbi:MAG: hypothetical protein WD081_06485 [Gammaproteobacteria bacterium]
MNSKPIKSDAAQLDLPVLDEVVDPDSDRARLMGALDELNRLIDRVPRGAGGFSDAQMTALKDDLKVRLNEMAEELAERLKQQIPTLVDQVVAEHLKRK